MSNECRIAESNTSEPSSDEKRGSAKRPTADGRLAANQNSLVGQAGQGGAPCIARRVVARVRSRQLPRARPDRRDRQQRRLRPVDAAEELTDAQVDPEAPSPHFADGSPTSRG